MRADDRRDHAQRAGFSLTSDRDARGGALGLVAPGDIDPVGIVALGQPRAVDHMHLDLLIGAAQAHDAVARHRMAAFGQVERDAGGQPLDRDRGLVWIGAARVVALAPPDPGIKASITSESVMRRRAIASISAALVGQLQPLQRGTDRAGGERGGKCDRISS